MSRITQWLSSHATAILATAVAISKAGLIGKSASAFVLALATAIS